MQKGYNQKCWSKGFATVYIFIGALVLLLVVLIVPLPYYQAEDTICLPKPNNTGICPKKGWYLGPPLWHRLVERNQVASQYEDFTERIPTPTPKISVDETANWKTYTYKNGEFSFKYPSNWYIRDGQELSDGYSISFFEIGKTVKLSMGMAKGNEQLIVGIKTDLYFKEIKKQLDLDTPSINLSGKEALKYTTGAYILLGPSEKRVLSIYRPEYPDQGELNQILATFKFTN